MVIALRSGYQRLRAQSLIAVFLATQFWEWYPLFHVIVKSFLPTGLFAVDRTLQLPQEVHWHCAAKPSRFAYVEMVKSAEESKEKKKSDVTFSFQEERHNARTLAKTLAKTSGRASTQEKEEAKKEEKGEPESFEVGNGSRITLTQWDVMSVPPQRFSLVVKDPRMKLLIAVVKEEEGGPVFYVNLRDGDGPSEVECPQPFVYSIPPEPVMNSSKEPVKN